ncbi:hypothetical protein PRIPAC_84698 [Pristionchus pacificus]|uniref:Zinc finger protein n=1 Tax=Pristionchus pacificus TaxID=54126 RepID=A0A2A6BGX6_PRIPA|nr:hypothetical protein PRIPAC_84698 [Pristionchus pacificus]|eukprot:PDM65132.1 zinc finger protein [Pristionchus pacificus]
MDNNEIVLYSRECPICLSESPCQRCVFTGCGHCLCRACAEQIAMEAGVSHKPVCPLCRTHSTTRPLIEMKEIEFDSFNDESKPVYPELLQNLPSPRLEELIQTFLRGEIDEETYIICYDMRLAEEACHRGINGGRPDDVYVEEYKRLMAILPYDGYFDNLAIDAAEATMRMEKQRIIDELRGQDNESGRYSRACGNCSSLFPFHRCVFKECGHLICRSCSDEMKSRSQIICPFCMKESETVPLFEHQIEA